RLERGEHRNGSRSDQVCFADAARKSGSEGGWDLQERDSVRNRRQAADNGCPGSGQLLEERRSLLLKHRGGGVSVARRRVAFRSWGDDHERSYCDGIPPVGWFGLRGGLKCETVPGHGRARADAFSHVTCCRPDRNRENPMMVAQFSRHMV